MSFQLSRLLARKIQRAATRARGSELKLQGEVDGYLREYLKAFGIDYDPEVNKQLRISDYSVTGRPDSLFGHVAREQQCCSRRCFAVALLSAHVLRIDC